MLGKVAYNQKKYSVYLAPETIEFQVETLSFKFKT